MKKIFAPFLPPWVETGLQPAFYDMESGTVLQQTARMYAKVQQLTRLFNELSEETKTEVENFEQTVNETVQEYIDKFTELKDFVDDYFDNLDVQEEINNKLDAMVEDGTLDEIVERYINLQPNVAEFLPYLRKGRKVVPKADKLADSEGYKAMQGGVMDSANTMSYITPHNSASGVVDNEICKVQKININTGAVLQQAEVELYHGNSMAYDRTTEHYYVATAHDKDNVPTNKIIELDSAFGYVDSYDVDKNYDSISVDENGVLYAGITYIGDTDAYKIDILNKEDLSVESTITLNPKHELGSATGQDFCVYGDRIYLISSFPNTIEIFDIDGNLIKIYTIGDHDYIEIGETENISTWDGKDFIFGSCLYRLDSVYLMNQIFITDFNIGCGRAEEKDRFVSTTYNVYVDSSSDIWNPDGTSSKPFYCIDELNCIDTDLTINANFSAGDYYVQTVLSNSICFEVGNNNVHIKAGKVNYIDFVGSKAFLNGNSHLTIDSTRAYKNSDLTINATALNKTINDWLLIASQGSTVMINGSTFSTDETYTNAYFVCDRSKFIYGKGNTDISNKGTTRFFKGDIQFLSHVKLFDGSVTLGNSTKINNGSMDSFKDILVRGSDQTIFKLYLDGGNRMNYTSTNFSGSGTGDNNIFNINIEKQSDNSIRLTKNNQITFDVNGVMSVTPQSSFAITGIFVG